jgi:CheY-like chemotaxis protein
VEVDSDRLIQVLTNLLSNAAKFSPKGEVVTVSVGRSEGRFRIAVSDRGPGIPPEFRDRIFQKFSQADSSDRRAKGGTGLGLSISKAIVENHGGSLSFSTETGKGSTFFIDLPEQIPAPPAAVSPARGAGARAIICDDEPQVAEIIRTVLLREGFDPVLAQTLGECRELMGKHPYALMTVDFMLPDGNGVDYIRELRKSEPTRQIPVILISPLAGTAREIGGDGIGPVEYLEKPIDLARLASAARAAMSGASTKPEGATP